MLKCNLHLSLPSLNTLLHNAKVGLWARLSCSIGVVSRPTYLSADLGFIAILLSAIFLYLLFSLSALGACWTEINQNRPHARNFWSKYNLKTHVRNVRYSLPTNRGEQNHLFRRLHSGNFKLAMTSRRAAQIINLKKLGKVALTMYCHALKVPRRCHC